MPFIPEQRSVLPFLPDDVARCRGVGEDGEWREGCENCARRLAPALGDRAEYLEPPPIVAFWCEYLIEG
jgi:hypothetical protein